MSESNEQLMRQFYDYWDAGAVDAMIACFAENGIYDNVPKKTPLLGREAIGAWLKMTFKHLDRI